jgi:hypothetical protein
MEISKTTQISFNHMMMTVGDQISLHRLAIDVRMIFRLKSHKHFAFGGNQNYCNNFLVSRVVLNNGTLLGVERINFNCVLDFVAPVEIV